MSMSVNFRGGESTGSVAERKPETARQETTGGVGARKKQDSIFLTDEPKCDTVCFRGVEYGYEEPKKSTSTLGVILGTAGVAAVIVGLMGLAHKYDAVGRIPDGRIKDILRHTDVATEFCHKACRYVKKYSYDALVNLFNKSKK